MTTRSYRRLPCSAVPFALAAVVALALTGFARDAAAQCAGWSCDPSYYDANDGCDCNCGCYDVDCDDPLQTTWGCADGESCVPPGVCDTGGGGGGPACAGWTCNADYFGAGDGCDCGCGCWDPDCGDFSQTVYGCLDGESCVPPGVCEAGGGGSACAGWDCPADYFGAGDGCDCGCGCWDPDCDDASQTTYGCEGQGDSCVPPGVCDVGGGGSICAGWDCEPSYFGAGDGCDCGCGCWDPDCDDASQTVYGCEGQGDSCVPPGVCDAGGGGTICAGWDCDPGYFGAGDGCDCGCGCWDPDCDDASQTTYGCEGDGDSCVPPGVCDAGGGGPACAGWNCAPDYFGAGDGCDCGCGCWDPDCDDPDASVYGCTNGESCVQPGVCDAGGGGDVCVGWTCDPTFHAAGDGCDCDCGCWDPDCDDPEQPVYGCDGGAACAPPGICEGGGGGPCEGWACDPGYYAAQDGCDCGCGCWDPDCDDPSETVYGCDPGEACVVPGVCEGEPGPTVCEGWSCNPTYYAAQDGCDCGCGCWDPDCDDPAQSVYGCDAGQACAPPGVCGGGGPGPGPCEGWACSESYYAAADGCDCDCGCWDPDCDDPSEPVYGCDDGQECVTPGVCGGGGGGVCAEWACNPSWYAAEDGCDCACGCWDPDCDDPTQEVYGCDGGQSCAPPGVCSGDGPGPGPDACVGWMCEPSYYATGDGCDCDCGCWDPDCDDPGQMLYNCEDGAVCAAPGVCVGDCLPQCAGRACGSDGCGGVCGQCPAGWSCTGSGQCTDQCTPNCAGRACGSDGCGGTCGTCAAGATCNASGQCQGSCTPSCAGRECGSNGCGGSCGTCDHGEFCDGSGRCQTGCEPTCAGRECGDDGCGGTCGSCHTGWHCSTVGVCEAGCAPDCRGRECGDNGCGGSCGQCPAGWGCSDVGRCTSDCTPDCRGRECGNDGCGGTCGACGIGFICDVAGACQPEGCTPECGDRECGPDGCGGACGACPTGWSCTPLGMCGEGGCDPQCDGKQCGDDGCGGSCGSCPDGSGCDLGGVCVVGGCTPRCEDRECGDDGCGGSCGACSAGTTCAQSGQCAFSGFDVISGADGSGGAVADGDDSSSTGSCATSGAAAPPTRAAGGLVLLLLMALLATAVVARRFGARDRA